MNNLEVLKQGYQSFAEGKLAEATENWAPDIVWQECKGMPFAAGDGTYRGIQEVISGVLAKIPEHIDDFNIEITDFVDGGDKIVMIGFYTGIFKATGKKFKANATHTWSFENGKAVHFFQAVDTAEIISPVGKAEAGKEMEAMDY